MNLLTPEAPPLLVEAPALIPAVRRRIAALVSLTKPRIALMVLITVGTGFVVGSAGTVDGPSLVLTLAGTALVAGGASAWNQYLERARDAKMRRTAGRALPSGQLQPWEAAAFGAALALLGTGMLASGRHPLAAGIGALTFVLYAFVYTPLKPITTLNTAVGAIPGALPVLIGWGAATGRLGVEAWSLFLIVFLWQFPHFLAIAWIHREDYARGGHKMLPSADPTGALTARQSVVYALALLPAGLAPAVLGLAGPMYFFGSLALGLYYLAAAVRFWLNVSESTARRLMGASFLYLPAVLLLLLLGAWPR